MINDSRLTPIRLLTNQNNHIQPTITTKHVSGNNVHIFAHEMIKAGALPARVKPFLSQRNTSPVSDVKPSVFMPGVTTPTSQATTSTRSSLQPKKKRRSASAPLKVSITSR